VKIHAATGLFVTEFVFERTQRYVVTEAGMHHLVGHEANERSFHVACRRHQRQVGDPVHSKEGNQGVVAVGAANIDR